MYKANRNCSSALRLINQNAKPTAGGVQQQELSAFKFNRDQFKQNALFYSSKSAAKTGVVVKPIKKLMVANRGLKKFLLSSSFYQDLTASDSIFFSVKIQSSSFYLPVLKNKENFPSFFQDSGKE
jgi:hypothetical protein